MKYVLYNISSEEETIFGTGQMGPQFPGWGELSEVNR